jgi:methionyl-tRNA formyltransferase
MNLGEPVRVVFIGCVGEAKRSLETLVEMGERVVAIITLRPDLAATVSGAIRWEAIAEASSIPLHFVRNANDPEAIELIRSLEPDLIYCVGWTQLLRRELLAIPRLGCIGFHASLLPKYRGRAPVNWAIIRGRRRAATR